MNAELLSLRDTWAGHWQEALAHWSRFTKLSEPRWCLTAADERREGLKGSFAMIRHRDQAVVISLAQVRELGLQRFAAEILAHEIGHHVYCPGTMLDHGRMLARMRHSLPTREAMAPLVANLYADLLINDRLQRSAGLDIAGVYRALGAGSTDRSWRFYMRIYEILWGLARASLATGRIDAALEGDAQLGARLVRSYSQDWLGGSGRFAALILPYLLEDNGKSIEKCLRGWLDTRGSGT